MRGFWFVGHFSGQDISPNDYDFAPHLLQNFAPALRGLPQLWQKLLPPAWGAAGGAAAAGGGGMNCCGWAAAGAATRAWPAGTAFWQLGHCCALPEIAALQLGQRWRAGKSKAYSQKNGPASSISVKANGPVNTAIIRPAEEEFSR